MTDLVASTATLINTLPPAGHGLTTGVMSLLQAQADHSGSFSGLVKNLNVYFLSFISAWGGIFVSWFFTKAAQRMHAPSADCGFWVGMRYDFIQWMAGLFDKSGKRQP